MRTKLIQNEEIKKLLEEKASIVLEGRNLNVEIEKKAEPVAAKFLLERKVIEDGESEDGYGDGTTKYKLFKGTYNQLQDAFKDQSIQTLQSIITTELEEDLNVLKSKELQVKDLNVKINELLTSDVLPTLELGEFEELVQIDLRGIDVELTIIDRLEDWKTAYLAKK